VTGGDKYIRILHAFTAFTVIVVIILVVITVCSDVVVVAVEFNR
jgi:hypothetical protein